MLNLSTLNRLPRKPTSQEEIAEECRQRLMNGESTYAIAASMDMAQPSLTQLLRRNGVFASQIRKEQGNAN